jgi:hypothetical protein
MSKGATPISLIDQTMTALMQESACWTGEISGPSAKHLGRLDKYGLVALPLGVIDSRY